MRELLSNAREIIDESNEVFGGEKKEGRRESQKADSGQSNTFSYPSTKSIFKTKKFLIEKLKEERKKLQDENAQIKKTLTDDRSKMQSRILTLEEENDKLQKETKNKKLAQQQQKALSELNKVSSCLGGPY